MHRKSHSLKTVLRERSHEELRALLNDLHKAVPEARRFIDARLHGANPVELAEFKQAISRGIRPDFTRDQDFDIRAARRAISAFQKACPASDYPLADLMLHYIEEGTELTREYGDIDERFYSSLCSMCDSFEAVFAGLSKTQQDAYWQRLDRLQDRAAEIGWGYGDYVAEVYGRLRIERKEES